MSLHIKICESDKCIYTLNINNIATNTNNLNGLISCLKETQIEINDFLTNLVEKQNSSVDIKSKSKIFYEET